MLPEPNVEGLQIRIRQLHRENKLLTGGVKQSARLQKLWSQSLAELKATKGELRTSMEFLNRVLTMAPLPIVMLSRFGHIVLANKAAERLVGTVRGGLIRRRILELLPPTKRQEALLYFREEWKESQPSTEHEFTVTTRNGDQRIVEAYWSDVSGYTEEDRRLILLVQDITERKWAETMAQLRQQLVDLVYQGDQQQLMRTALDAAEEMTLSQIGFFHFVEGNQDTISLQVWSTRTLKETCYAEGEILHYPASEAGVWVDCIHQRKPVIHNDYASLPHKKGMPEGHAKLIRELTVPVIRNNLITAVIGVGNKIQDYTQRDVEILTQIADIAFDYIERQQADQQVEYMAYYDVLTGLPNRVLLTDRLNQAVAQCYRSKQLLAVCYLDLDEFKPINDRHGHHTGDALLINLSQLLKDGLREGDTLARLGGDEFVFLLTGLSTPYECEEAVQRTLDTIKNPIEIEGRRFHISGSIGVTIFPTDNTDPDALLRHADQAMYQAKKAGKSAFHLNTPVQDQKLRTHRQMLADIEHALHHHQLVLHYQPKVDLRNGKVIGVEALLRWQHPERDLLYPGMFLPYIEDSPQEVALGEWVVKAALTQYMRWREQGIMLPISINISPRHIQLRGFADFLADELSHYPEDTAGYLELEVLETAAIGDTKHVSQVMDACSRLGVHFSLDDFGTGYSSLTYFHKLPIDVLKIDQNFIRDMLDNGRDLDIVEGVLRLAETLQRPVVAEGVETVETGLMLLQLGCRYAQGYGIARPMPAVQLPGWLAEWQTNNIWSQLDRETRNCPEAFDLNVTIFSYRRWLEMVIQYLRDESATELPPIYDKQCHFERWYKGIGRKRYGDQPIYAFILPKYGQVHALAESLVSQAESGERKMSLSRIDELKGLSQELIVTLQKLAQ